VAAASADGVVRIERESAKIKAASVAFLQSKIQNPKSKILMDFPGKTIYIWKRIDRIV